YGGAVPAYGVPPATWRHDRSIRVPHRTVWTRADAATPTSSPAGADIATCRPGLGVGGDVAVRLDGQARTSASTRHAAATPATTVKTSLRRRRDRRTRSSTTGNRSGGFSGSSSSTVGGTVASNAGNPRNDRTDSAQLSQTRTWSSKRRRSSSDSAPKT